MNWTEVLIWLGTGGIVGGLFGLGITVSVFGPLFMTFLIAKFKRKWILFEENPSGLIKLKLADYDSPTGCLKAKEQTFKLTNDAYRLENNMNIALVSNECMLSQSPLLAGVLNALKAKGIAREDLEGSVSLRTITDYLESWNEPAQEDALRNYEVMVAKKEKDDVAKQFAKIMTMAIPGGIVIMIVVIAYLMLQQGLGPAQQTAASIPGILPM